MTRAELEAYDRSLIKKESGSVDPGKIETALDSFHFPTYIQDAKARIVHIRSQCFERLESIGYEEFLTDNPKQSIYLMLIKIQQLALRAEMQSGLRFDLTLEKIFPNFVSSLTDKAVWCQKYGHSVCYKKGGNKDDVKRNKYSLSPKGDTTTTDRGDRTISF